MRLSWLLRIAAASLGLGLALLTGFDGSWWWCLARVAGAGLLAWLMIVVLGRASDRSGAMLAFAVGVVATPSGGAIGWRDVTSGQWSVRTVGAIIVAMAGLELLVVASIILLRSVRGWRRVPVVVIGLLALYLVGVPCALAVTATNVPRSRLDASTPADRGVDYTDVEFTTTDGVTLSGWYLPSSNRAAVVLLHGASSSRSDVMDQAIVLARHGYGVLMYDARGAGHSAGRAMNLGWYGDRDVAGAVDFLVGRSDVDPDRIAAVGESMGGEVAIGALAADGRLRAVVAEGATNRVADDWAWLSDAYGWRGAVQEQVNRLTQEVTDVLTDATPPKSLRAAVAAASPRPILLIAAGNVPDEARADEYIRRAAPDSVQVWVVPGSEHTGGLRADADGWEQRVTEFLRAAIGPTG